MITTRLATPDDLPAARDLHIASCRAAYRRLVPDEVLDGPLPRNLRRIWAGERLANGDFILLAEREGALVGLATVRWSDDPYIDHFHVAPDAKRGGIGRALWRALVAELRKRGATRAHLDMARGNDGALAFYRAMGGEKGAEMTGDLFGHPLPALTIRWPDLSRA